MYKWILIGIVFLAFVLRVVNLSNLPGGFTPDEASFGYDAYSLLKTGKDQWGNSWPTTFKSFGDYKLPVYTYLTLPTVAFFGLSEFAVRLPNAIIGTLAILTTYLLLHEFSDKRHHEDYIALLGALFIAVSPWHIALSRGAFEANLTTFFMSLGAYLFLAARRNQWLLSLAMLSFGINMFTYHSARLVTPLVVMSLLWFYRSDFLRKKKYTLASLVFLIFFIAAFISFFQGSGSRAATSSIFGEDLGSGVIRAHVAIAGMPQFIAKFIYNEPLFKLGKFIQNYCTYFSPSFLFTEGAHEPTYGMIPGVGVLTIVEYLGLPFFILRFIRKKDKSTSFLSFWLLVAPIPAALSVGPGNAANRAAIMMPAIQGASAIGLFYAFSLVKARISNILIPCAFILSLILGLSGFYRYYFEEPVNAPNGMMYGMRETFNFLREYPDKYIVLSRSLSEPQIFAEFFDPINPGLAIQASKRWNFEEQNLRWVDQMGTYYVGRYTITSIQKTTFQENVMVVGKPDEIPENARIVKTILTPDKRALWVIAEKNE